MTRLLLRSAKLHKFKFIRLCEDGLSNVYLTEIVSISSVTEIAVSRSKVQRHENFSYKMCQN